MAALNSPLANSESRYVQCAQDPVLSFAVHAQPPTTSQGALAAPADAIPSHPSYAVHFS